MRNGLTFCWRWRLCRIRFRSKTFSYIWGFWIISIANEELLVDDAPVESHSLFSVVHPLYCRRSASCCRRPCLSRKELSVAGETSCLVYSVYLTSWVGPIIHEVNGRLSVPGHCMCLLNTESCNLIGRHAVEQIRVYPWHPTPRRLGSTQLLLHLIFLCSAVSSVQHCL